MSYRFVSRSLFVLIILSALSIGGCASLGPRLVPPEVSLVSVVPLASSGFEQQFEIKVRVLNPNEVPLEGNGLDVRLDMNGQRLGRALSSDQFLIPRLGDETLTLVATTNMIDVFRQALALPNAGGKLDYVLKGRVLLKGSVGWVSFRREGSLNPNGSRTR